MSAYVTSDRPRSRRVTLLITSINLTMLFGYAEVLRA